MRDLQSGMVFLRKARNMFKTIITNIESLKMNLIPYRIIKQIKDDEGFRSKAYECPAGKLTIGYGRNIESNGITEQEAEHLLMNDIKGAQRELRSSFPWFTMLSTARQGALINMCFNIGLTRMLDFKKMIAALEVGDYKEAANQMLDSKWARQVGDRATRLADEMRGQNADY